MDYENAHLLISPEHLQERLHHGKLKLIDVRGVEEWESSTIPGAVPLNIDELSNPEITTSWVTNPKPMKDHGPNGVIVRIYPRKNRLG